MEDLESLIKINQYKINETDTCSHSANSYTKPTVNIEKNTMRRIRKVLPNWCELPSSIFTMTSMSSAVTRRFDSF